MTNHFNTHEFKQALCAMWTNPLESKVRYEEYIKKYPSDYSAYVSYASTLIVLGHFEEAEEILDYVEAKYITNNKFLEFKDKVEFLENGIILNRLKLLSYQKKYEEFYKLYLDNIKVISHDEVWGVVFYCKHQLGILSDEEKEVSLYFQKQILDYSEEAFVKHIQKHLASSNLELADGSGLFCVDFPIEKMISEIKKYIPSDKRLYKGYYQNAYVFNYDRCGRNAGRTVDHFKVITFNDTDKLITMCPATNREYLPSVDMNYMAPKTKVKRLSQIEKFNKRYNRN